MSKLVHLVWSIQVGWHHQVFTDRYFGEPLCLWEITSANPLYHVFNFIFASLVYTWHVYNHNHILVKLWSANVTAAFIICRVILRVMNIYKIHWYVLHDIPLLWRPSRWKHCMWYHVGGGEGYLDSEMPLFLLLQQILGRISVLNYCYFPQKIDQNPKIPTFCRSGSGNAVDHRFIRTVTAEKRNVSFVCLTYVYLQPYYTTASLPTWPVEYTSWCDIVVCNWFLVGWDVFIMNTQQIV